MSAPTHIYSTLRAMAPGEEFFMRDLVAGQPAAARKSIYNAVRYLYSEGYFIRKGYSHYQRTNVQLGYHGKPDGTLLASGSPNPAGGLTFTINFDPETAAEVRAIALSRRLSFSTTALELVELGLETLKEQE